MALSEKTNMSDNEKEEIIAQALATEAGREALAQAMVEPIKIALEYQAVGRKCLMTDELPQGALARYERDIAVKSYVLGKRGAVPDYFTEVEELLVPTFEIATNPTIRLSEVKARRFYIVDRAQMKAKEAIQREEDTNIFSTIAAAIPAAHTVNVAGNLTVSALNSAFAEIESHDLTVAKIVMHPMQYKDVRNFGKNVYDEATTREVLLSGLFGHLWTADSFVSRFELQNSLKNTALTGKPKSSPKKIRQSRMVKREISKAIYRLIDSLMYGNTKNPKRVKRSASL